MIRRQPWTLPFLALLLALLASCWIGGLDPCLPPGVPSEEGRGAMLVRSGSWLYRLGGWDDSVLSSPRVSKALLGEEGEAEGWQESASLPGGLRHGAAFSAGNFVYVLGGSDDKGPVDTVYYTAVHADGSLGFGADDHWEANIRPLPEGRSSAAWVVYDGWIFLIGGVTATGATSSGATNSIIRARIYQDGQVGQWYTSAEILPEALWGASAAELDGRLYVAGGADAQGAGALGVKAGMVSFALGADGALSDRRIETDLPIALQKPILLADRGDLILAGGFSGESWASKVYRYHDGLWTETPFAASAEGPFFGHAGGSLLYQRSLGTEATDIGRLEGLNLAPEAPTVQPGSGLVPAGSPVLVGMQPGVTVRYRTDGLAPSAADPAWPGTLAAPFTVSSENLPSMELSLVAFGPDGSVSPVTHREYLLRSGSLFVVTEGTLPLHEAGYSGLDSHSMPIAANSLWYRMRIDRAGAYRLAWADADQNPAYSARIMLTVYEADLYTEVPDRDGADSPLSFVLGAGDYYLQISDLDGQEGRNFGLSLSKE
ncbi:MAG: hypothetical protein CVV53_00105 [Spirochaetae bacterium HGW-Spirochaetae-9]|nr:MAG: hypothetical protein CVV53_00105 [Spirochaetae bacterium HGW-Spirochaetae-9]